MKIKTRLAGIDSNIYKLSEVKGALNQKEVDSIFKYSKLGKHIYGRFCDGVLVIFCSVKVAHDVLDRMVAEMAEKAKSQKQKGIFKAAVFEYSH